ncbi:uncharacterized protein BXIN_2975 [Babesia sp. Xinjiang]|uniref:uncharacterized protein n=1 Tax=Babesia sp. Xinjiang TaxID=462227 RepID=UPI000A25FCFA|nr:uncharacterized protein BXIN_2975 [Babesia sp. Xinjiang]ORM39449.1 hypothetical protein BXIN_2975 [Babesia sp. Xinjiang]
MTYEGESEWLLEVESLPSDVKVVAPQRKGFFAVGQPPITSVSTGLSEDGDNTPESLASLDGKKSMQQYIEEISQLNSAIDEFSKIIQTLALFKYYIRNRKGNTNVDELHKRFNSFSVKCANKIRIIQQHVAAVNRENHYAMAHREVMNYSYSDLRARFNMQDASVNRLKTLMETYQSVIKEYTAAAKSIEEEDQAVLVSGAAAPLLKETAAEQPSHKCAEATLIDELKSKSKDIMTLEKNARDLNQLFAELNTTIKKRGENIYNLEQQILLSAEQIDKGKDDMTIALKSRGGQVLNWVMARGKIPQDCNKRLLSLEDLCKGFFDKYVDLPENVKQLRKHVLADYTEWYEVLSDINEKLKETEEGKKQNFIGQYAYEPLYEADKILKAFHKHNLHIVSYFQLLQKQIMYNVPSIRKSIDNLKKELVDYKNRKNVCMRKLKTGSGELRSRLQLYNIDIDEYPFDEDFVECLKVKLLHKITAKNAEMTIANYKKTIQLTKLISADVVPIFTSFVKLNDMENLYVEETTMKNIRHAAEHGMDIVTSDENEGYVTKTEPEAAADAPDNNVVKGNDHIPIEKESNQIIFDTNIGNPSFRQLLLGELLELLTFVKVRIDELQNRADTASYIFSRAGGKVNNLVQQPLSSYEKYMEFLNEAIELISGTGGLRSLSVLKNRSELEKCAQAELDIFNRCYTAVTEQTALTKRIETAEEALEKLNGELEAVRSTIRETKQKLEKVASEVMEESVTLFGEIDEI